MDLRKEKLQVATICERQCIPREKAQTRAGLNNNGGGEERRKTHSGKGNLARGNRRSLVRDGRKEGQEVSHCR